MVRLIKYIYWAMVRFSSPIQPGRVFCTPRELAPALAGRHSAPPVADLVSSWVFRFYRWCAKPIQDGTWMVLNRSISVVLVCLAQLNAWFHVSCVNHAFSCIVQFCLCFHIFCSSVWGAMFVGARRLLPHLGPPVGALALQSRLKLLCQSEAFSRKYFADNLRRFVFFFFFFLFWLFVWFSDTSCGAKSELESFVHPTSVVHPNAILGQVPNDCGQFFFFRKKAFCFLLLGLSCWKCCSLMMHSFFQVTLGRNIYLVLKGDKQVVD